MGIWSIGIGTTNRCNLKCAHCYSREKAYSDLNYDQVKHIINNLDVESINFGTGENILNNDYLRILDLIKERNIKMGLTSNGYTVMKLPDSYLKYFNDIDISLEFPSSEKQSLFRGEGSWDTALAAIERCKKLDIETSIACCMMNINVNDIPDFRMLMKEYDVNLRINTYKPVNTDEFVLTYEEFWNGFKNIMSSLRLVACSEPIVNAVLGISDSRSACGCGKKSLRVNPDGTILPCVYWNKSPYKIEDIQAINENTFDYIRSIPKECKKCKYVQSCGGGCEGRRLHSDLNKPDEYCPFIRGDVIELPYVKAESKDLVHSSYLCTTIFCV